MSQREDAPALAPDDEVAHDEGVLFGLTRGIRYMIASAVCFSIMSLLVKLVGRTMESPQIVLARSGFALILSWIGIRRLGISPWGEQARGLLFLRGFLGFAGLSCFYYAITHLPLGDATVIMYLNPMLVAILAALWLKERIGRVELIAVLVSIAGVALVARPSFLFGAVEGSTRALDPVAVGVALLGAFISAGAYTTVRALGGREHPLVVVLYFPLIATPLSIPYAWSVLRWPSPLEWLMLAGIGVSTQAAQIYMTRGLALERAGRATSITYLQVVFAYGWGALVFGELPPWWSGIGALLILSSAIFVAQHRARAAA